MLNVSDALKQIYRRNMLPLSTVKADIQGKISFGDLGVDIGNDRIVKDTFRLTEMISDGGDLDFGSTNASVVEFTVADVPEDLNGQRFTITQTVNGTYTVPLGTFTVDSCKRQDNLRFKDIVAYDDMQKFNRNVADWYNGLTFPITVKGMRESLCQYCGVTYESVTLVNDNVRVYKTLDTNELNGKEVLRAIAEVNGTFAHINRYAKLTFIGLDSFALYPSETLYPADDLYPIDVTEIVEKQGENAIAYISSKYQDYTVSAIDGVIVRDDENADGGVTVGETTNPYVISGNMLIVGKSTAELTTIAQNILAKIGQVVYTPHDTESIGLPYVEVGDTVLNANSADKELFIAKRVLTGVSSVMDNFSATGNPKRENYDTVDSTEIRRLKGITTKIVKEIDRVGVEIENFETQTNTNFTVMDGRIVAEISRAQGAESSLQQSINGLRYEVSGKIGEEDAKTIFSAELGKITLGARQIDLDGYFKVNGNFTIDNDGNMALVGDGYRVDLRSYGFYVGNDGSSDLATYVKAGSISFADERYKSVAQAMGLHYDGTIAIGQKGIDYFKFVVEGDDAYFYNLDSVDGVFKTLETITLQCTAINNGTPITTANVSNYLGAFNSSNTKISYTSVGNINIMSTDGFIAESDGKYGNIASTGWVQGKVADLREEIAELRALING